MKFKIASTLLALTMSVSSFANCALSTNNSLASEVLAEKGFEIVERSQALYHIEVTDVLEVSEKSCSLGFCKVDVQRKIGVAALNSIDLKGYELFSSSTRSVFHRKSKNPKIDSNEAELRKMMTSLEQHLRSVYNDCRPLPL